MKNNTTVEKWEREARLVYEATRIEAAWSERSIVPEPWEDRDDKFKKNMINIIEKYISLDKLPTPEEAHDSWMKAYFDMGWKYGEKRDVDKKEHPDLVPFDELPKDERDKDAIFLAFVWIVKAQAQSVQEAKAERDEEWSKKLWDYAKKQCDSFDLVGIHRCSYGHCERCGECDLLSDLLFTLNIKSSLKQEEKHV